MEFIEVEAARHLLVMFPGIASGPVGPEIWRDDLLPAVAAHRLYFGTKSSLLVDPVRSASEAAAAVEIIDDIADRLAISVDNIICIGHSLAGTTALFIGLAVQAGYILVGAPAIRLGTWMRHLHELPHRDDDIRMLFDHFYDIGGLAQAPENQNTLDRLLPTAIRQCRHSATIEVFISRVDALFNDSLWLWNEIWLSGPLHCELELADYLGHERMEEPFYEHLKERLEAAIPKAVVDGADSDRDDDVDRHPIGIT